MSFLGRYENRLAWLALPGLVRWWAVLQFGVFLMGLFRPDLGITARLQLDWAEVGHGEVWRLLTFIFVSGTTSVFWAVMGLMFDFWMGDVLEQAWGAVRLTVYFLGTSVLLAVANWLTDGAHGGEVMFLHMSLFLCLAALAPNEVIRLYFLIPIKLKWLALMNFLYLGFSFVVDDASRWLVVATLVPFFLMFGREAWDLVRHRARVSVRRAQFERAQRPEGDAFHRCHLCAQTEHDDAQLEFRVDADGEEYCGRCRPIV
jgi:hypothetical protein